MRPAQPSSLQQEPLPAQYRNLQPPKAVDRVHAAGGGYLLFFGIVWTLFSALFLIGGVRNLLSEQQRYDLLQSQGKAAQARVTHLKQEGTPESFSYNVYYQFDAPVQASPTTFEVSDAVSPALFSTLHVGQEVPVIYAAPDPAVARLKENFGPPDLPTAALLIGIGALLVLIGITMLRRALAKLEPLWALRRSGKQAQATILARWQEQDDDDEAAFTVAYAFIAQGGTQRVIAHSEYNRRAYQDLQVGSVVAVRYLPEKPHTCQLIL